MQKGRCDASNKEHVRSCKKCLEYYKKISPMTILPFGFELIKKTQKKNCILSAIEVLYLLKDFRVRVLEDASGSSDSFFNSLQDLFFQMRQKSESTSISIDQCAEILSCEYDSVIIEDVFDAFQAIFHKIHSTRACLQAKCPAHQVIFSDINEKLTCKCSLSQEFNRGSTAFYINCVGLNDQDSIVDQINKMNSDKKCYKCRENTMKVHLKSNNTDSSLMFIKILQDNTTHYNFGRILVSEFRLSEILQFSGIVKCKLFMIIAKKNRENHYFVMDNDNFYNPNGEFFNPRQVTEHMYNKNISVTGVVYLLEKEAGVEIKKYTVIGNKAEKLEENICKCGKKCQTGETLCKECMTGKLPAGNRRYTLKIKSCACGKCEFCREKANRRNSEEVKKKYSGEIAIKSTTIRCARCNQEISSPSKYYSPSKTCSKCSNS